MHSVLKYLHQAKYLLVLEYLHQVKYLIVPMLIQDPASPPRTPTPGPA